MNNQLLFFTACNHHYKQFIIPYIYMAHKFNPTAKFEFLIDKKDNTLLQNIKKLQNFCNISDIKIVDLADLHLNTNINFDLLRFLIEPSTKADYTYIGDIDILITENILPFHLNQLKQMNTIFSNQLRYNNNNLMSGLHFVKNDEWFTQTKAVRNKYLNLNKRNVIDEMILANICKESKLNMTVIPKTEDEFILNRPVHGIHISLHRKPFTNIMEFPINDFKNNFLNTIYTTDEFKKVFELCDQNFKQTINKCIEYSTGNKINNIKVNKMNFLNNLANKTELNIFLNDNDLFQDLNNLNINKKCNIYIYSTYNKIYNQNNFIIHFINNLPENKSFDIIFIDSEFILNKLYTLKNNFTYIISNSYLNSMKQNNIVEKIKNYIIYQNKIVINNINPINNTNNTLKYKILNTPNIQEETDKKIGVIYTANIGNYDSFQHHKVYDLNNFDYVYLTLSSNKNKIPYPWKTIYVDNYFSNIDLENKNDTVRIARWCKTHPHIFFKDYEISIWVDGNTSFIVDPLNIIKDIKFDYLLTQIHPSRHCIYTEAAECIKLKADNADIINKEIQLLKQNNYPVNNGLVQTNILVRKHNNSNCIQYMNEWWNLIKNYSRRDQLSFNYIAWKFNLEFTALPYKTMTDKYIHWNAKH